MWRKVPGERLDEYVSVALWYRRLRDTNNENFMPLFGDESRYLVLKGGGGSGKSIFAGRKVLERVTGEAGHRALVCRKVAKTIRESCFKQIIFQASEYYPGCGCKPNKSDLLISFVNGSEIIFAGLDDVEKLKSIYQINSIWIEEAAELEESDFNQLDIRLRGESEFYKQIILTFNPVSITHWLKKRFFDYCDSRARVHNSTYKDNRFLDCDAIRVLEEFKNTDEYYYMVYCLNQWGVTGRTVFDARKISARLERLKMPLITGLFEYDTDPDGLHISNIRWVNDPGGPIKIYKAPEEGRPYVIGGDTAGDGSDWFVGQVLDNITGEQVCKLRHQYEEDVYARQMYCLGMYYNEALIGIETNFSTYPVKLLDLMGYRRLFVREVEDDFTGSVRKAFGFRTDKITRPVIIAELVKSARDKISSVNDEETLLEMLTFVRNPKLRPEAEEGANDDCVIALAIAHYIRPQQSMRAKSKEADGVDWTADMWADYNRASSQDKKYLMAKWGKPRR